MNSSDRDFENYLRDFHPRQPRALPDSQGEESWQWRRLAAAVFVALACGNALWLAHLRGASPQTQLIEKAKQKYAGENPLSHPASILDLQRLGLDNSAKFDAELIAASRVVLPRFTDSHSSLHVLAKD